MSTLFILLFVTGWSSGTWTNSWSNVRVTHYRRVPYSVHVNFYKMDSGGSLIGLERAKIIPSSIPISHVEYRVEHPRRPQIKSQLKDVTPGPGIQIGERLQRPSLPTPDKSKEDVNSIEFPIADYIINSGGGRRKGSTKPLDLSPILFPEDEILFSGRPSYPPYKSIPQQTTTTTTTTTTEPTIITFENEERDKKLTDEFLAWIKSTGMEDTGEQDKGSSSSFSLVNAGSLTFDSKCPTGHRLDQNGNCRKRFG